jgi:hypothetical protein
LYCTSSRCTRARVAAETSARSSSTWRRWPATHRRRRNGFQGGAAVPGHSSTPFRWPQRPWNRAGRSSSRRVTRSVSMLDSHHEHWTNRTKGAASRMPLKRLDEHVDATKVGAYCASKNGSFARYQNSRRVWSGHLTFARAGASCADRQSGLQGNAGRTHLIHLRARSARPTKRL